ncbi:MAG: hypothetical protein K5891_09255 [Lachnospiraceae bacterium]|nr:hypothetical protein [Lachnospiraceae bacterium]
MNLLRMFSWEKYKGEPGYLKKQRRWELARTILYFVLALGVFFLALSYFKTRANIFTVFAVLLCLPGSKSLVETVMFYRYQGCDEGTAARILEASGHLCGSFDRVFTSSSKNFPILHLALSQGKMAALTADPAFDDKAFSEHLKTLLNQEHLKVPVIKVYRQEEDYLNRLKEMKPSAEEEASRRILTVLHQVSL